MCLFRSQNHIRNNKTYLEISQNNQRMNFHLIIAALFCLSLGAVNGSLSKMRRTSRKYIRVGGRSQSEFGRTIDLHEVEAEATAV